MNKKFLSLMTAVLACALCACGSNNKITGPGIVEGKIAENFTDVEGAIIYQAPKTKTVTKEVINQENGQKENKEVQEEITYSEKEGYYELNVNSWDGEIKVYYDGYTDYVIPQEVWEQWGEPEVDFFNGDVVYVKQNENGLQAFKLIEQEGEVEGREESAETAEEPEVDPQLIGEWITTVSEDEEYSITFKEDGTVTINGTECTWQKRGGIYIGYAIAGDLYNGTFYYYNDSDKGYLEGYFSLDENSTDQFSCIKKSEFDIIELTVENFWDYIEIEEEYSFDTNAFDEATDVYYDKNLVYKEDIIPELSEAVVECTALEQQVTFTCDFENQTFTLGEPLEGDEYYKNSSTTIYTISKYSDGKCRVASMHVNMDINKDNLENGYDITEDGQPYDFWITDMELLRVTGKIYVLK